MSYLLDTNVVSEMRRRRNPNLTKWVAEAQKDVLYLSVLTLGEIRKGIERIRPRDPSQAEVFEEWLAGLHAEFQGQILSVDSQVADEWGRLGVSRELPETDGLLAATARVHGLTVATRNTADFEPCGVAVVNPWEFGKALPS